MKIFKRILVIGGNTLLLILLSGNLWQLYQSYLTAQDLLNQQLLTSDPDALIRNINQAGGSLWLWGANILAVLIGLFLLIGWFTPVRYKKWFWTFNWIWLLAWLVYLLASAVLLIVLVNQLA
ncbi:MAG: hypothetical protein WC553_03590 [Patescibacteria group bacterium]|jgi:hypothetical protein